MKKCFKKCLLERGITECNLDLRLSFIPSESKHTLEYAWKNGIVNRKQYDIAFKDLLSTDFLVTWNIDEPWSETRIEFPLFKEGFDDFNLAVSCGRLYMHLFGSGHEPFDKTARDFYENLIEKLGNLPDITQKIILLRFGFEDGKFYTLEDTAQELNFSKGKIHFEESIAIKELRNNPEGLDFSKEFYEKHAAIAKADKEKVKYITSEYLAQLNSISISSLRLSKVTEEVLTTLECITLGNFLIFKVPSTVPTFVAEEINQKKSKFFKEMFNI